MYFMNNRKIKPVHQRIAQKDWIMSRCRDLRSQGFRLFFGVIMTLAAVAMRPEVAHAWATNGANCTSFIVLTAGQTLSFGSIIGSAGGGTVTVSTASGITATGVTSVGGTVTAATFTGTDPGVNPSPPTGCTTRTVTVDVAGGATLIGPGTNMTVSAMTDSVTENGTGLWDYRSVPIYVGGTLNVNASQATGSYSGTFTITITYQ